METIYKTKWFNTAEEAAEHCRILRRTGLNAFRTAERKPTYGSEIFKLLTGVTWEEAAV
jgi:hypothetical protein